MNKGKMIGQSNTAEVFAYGEDRIVKLFRQGMRSEACTEEFEVLKALEGKVDCIPKAYELLELENRFGAVYERIEGHTLIEETMADPSRIGSVGRDMARCHVALQHAVDITLPTVKQKLERHINATQSLSTAQKKAVLHILAALPDGNTLCHYDLHPNNIMRNADGKLVVIDWANACTGHPLADVARTCVVMRYGELVGADGPLLLLLQQMRQAAHTVYLEEYCRLTGADPAHIEKWELPIIAGRFAESIPPSEAQVLLGILEEKLLC